MYQPIRKDAFKLLLDGSLALAQVESSGMRIDVPYLNKAIEDATNEIKRLETELRADKIYDLWRRSYGEKINLGSRDQIANIVFNKLGYESEGTTGKGKRASANKAALGAVKLPFVDKWLLKESLRYDCNTFLCGIRDETIDGYLHPSFNLHLARSYRSSADSPNSQNWPIRDKARGERIRRCFIPRGKKRRVVEVDFKGAEVKVAYFYHKDPVMKKYLTDPTTDMHRDMAMQIYCIDDPKQVSKTARDCAKGAFVFAQFYGDYYIHCAKGLWDYIDQLKLTTVDGVPLKKVLAAKGIKRLGDLDPRQEPGKDTFEGHLKKIEKDFWGRRFQVYAKWKEQWWADYQKKGYFDMLTGFRVSGLGLGEEGESKKNAATNYPVQGSSFHGLLWTLIEEQKWLDLHRMKCKIIGQVHDSIILDCPDDELQDVLDTSKELVSVKLPKTWTWQTIPIEVEADVAPIGASWFDKEPWIVSNNKWQPKN